MSLEDSKIDYSKESFITEDDANTIVATTTVRLDAAERARLWQMEGYEIRVAHINGETVIFASAPAGAVTTDDAEVENV